MGQAELVEVTAYLRGERLSKENRYCPSGVNYRSICARCNNALLGARYDPELIAFCQVIDQAARDRLYVPMTLSTRPNRLVRSVVGHLVAHGLDLYQTGEFFVDMSRYFLDETAVLPDRYRMYCWLYPYNDQFVAQCIGSMSHLGARFVLMSVLKFYPVSFVLMYEGDSDGQSGLVRLDHLLSDDLDASVDVTLPISGLPPKRWPEAPGSHGMVMHSTLSKGALRR